MAKDKTSLVATLIIIAFITLFILAGVLLGAAFQKTPRYETNEYITVYYGSGCNSIMTVDRIKDCYCEEIVIKDAYCDMEQGSPLNCQDTKRTVCHIKEKIRIN